ncbi:MAG: phosphohistidine phosphatase SixA [Porticoccaceae bacterium]
MKLYLMRHGEALPPAVSDPARPLTPRGWRQVEAVIARRRRDLVDITLIAASPYVRATETATGVIRALGYSSELVISHQLQPDTSVHALGTFVEACAADELLLVSHQPLVGATLAWLTGREELAAMGTADLAALELTAFTPGGARLLWLERGA